jgi:hypothetical protein
MKRKEIFYVQVARESIAKDVKAHYLKAGIKRAGVGFA